MSASGFLEPSGPPRKKMRKGTKSCTECRRRKIRCTFDQDRPNVCNECHSRGSPCIDQELGTLDPNVAGVLPGEQPYSLRERVTQLENVVRDILQRMNQTSPSESESPTQQPNISDPCGISCGESTALPINSKTIDAPLTEGRDIESAPVLQLLNNNIVSRTETAVRSHDGPTTKNLSEKADAVRNQLLKLVPSCQDLLTIRNGATFWWAAWQYMFPELSTGCRSNLVGTDDMFQIPSSPGELAKFLICLLMSIEQLPLDFNYAALQNPFNPDKYAERVISEIDRLVIYDDDLSSTLPGLEAMVLMSKWYMNLGRPRKSWILNRRAIELGQLSGLHISTRKEPRPGDTLYDRRLKLWTFIGLNDRFLGLLFGLPYAIHENSFRPQVERRLKNEKPTLETFALRLSLVMGPLIDRNMDDPADMSLATTLRLEQELENHSREMPDRFWVKKPGANFSIEEQNDYLVTPFLYHFLRTLIHMPFMLKSYGDRKYQYNRDVALESARCALRAYGSLRSWEGMNPYICRVIDFQAFTSAMLLVINLLGYSEDAPNHSEEQDDKDWALVHATVEVLQKAADHPTGTVAAQSVNILAGISKTMPNMSEFQDSNITCKVTVPYFGVITVAPGKGRRPRLRNRQQAADNSSNSNFSTQPSRSTVSSEQTSPFQIYTPPQSNPSDLSTGSSDHISGTNTTSWASSLMDDPRIQLENMVAFPNSGVLDQNAFTGFTFDHDNLGAWSNLNLDLDLDQGWDMNWTDGGILQ
ncbi:putative C6 finger domain protein [Talaromyces proteolyticus]|uniref:C6 finger domain protein n=1 Tax=Talaromyces proteolyticus TaxID=1131652 RepID=A0AAD4Q5J0_9EURO|nr:putative C6 finger domain protein [Talaromyces proteolyticus]KAH8704045.1 putative C6 finger domain protein [Talaromyces proteolyticus]